VAISLGDGKVVEAANRRAGVRESTAGERFEYAAVLPGISDGSGTPLAQPAALLLEPVDLPVAPPPPPPELGGPDSDHDGLSDALERRMGLDPLRADTDGDNLSDAQELITYGTDGRKADTDADGLSDAFELAQGLNPLSPDSDADGHLDGALTPLQQVDTDQDGMDDALERVMGLNPALADSDADGFSDGLEYHSGSGPLDPNDNPLLHRPGVHPVTPGSDPSAFGQMPGSALTPGTATAAVPGQIPGAAPMAAGAGPYDDPLP
jgi:hypothetical protein